MNFLKSSLVGFVTLAIVLLCIFIIPPILAKFGVTDPVKKTSFSLRKLAGSVEYDYSPKEGKSIIRSKESPVSGDVLITTSRGAGSGTTLQHGAKYGKLFHKDPNNIIVRLEYLPPGTDFVFSFDSPPSRLVATDSQGNQIPVNIIGQDTAVVDLPNY